MYFKRLEIVGFKSFAEKTKLDFEAGVTAIVGPNGCGKSNLTDSIKWVLGEQSVRSMRSVKMEDIIFHGADNIEPIGFAEVSLTISNQSKLLPLDYEEITITRRIFRSGESEYLINKIEQVDSNSVVHKAYKLECKHCGYWIFFKYLRIHFTIFINFTTFFSFMSLIV